MDLDTVLDAAAADAAEVAWHFHDGDDLIEAARRAVAVSLVTDVWVFDEPLEQVALVCHRRHGWVMPGGRVEDGELIRHAAARELAEEAGVVLDQGRLAPAALSGRIEPETGHVYLRLSYSVVVSPTQRLQGEPQQPAQWWRLADQWPTIYDHDRPRLLHHVERLGSQRLPRDG